VTKLPEFETDAHYRVRWLVDVGGAGLDAELSAVDSQLNTISLDAPLEEVTTLLSRQSALRFLVNTRDERQRAAEDQAARDHAAETARREKVAESYRYYLEEIESSRDGLGSRHYAGTIIPHPYTEEEEAEHRRKQAERRSEAEASIKRVLAEEDWLRAEVEVQQAKDAHKRNALRAAESAWLEEEKRWESRFTPFNRDIPSGAKASFIAKYLREQGVSVSGY
jgi:hypothetical protein